MRIKGSGLYPHSLVVRVSAPTVAGLDLAAAARGVKPSDVAREYLERGLKADGHWPADEEKKPRRKS
jgi:hypothetical protein